MDYEKKYKQLHTLIGDLYPFMSKYCKEKVEVFFPELKKSEDERIKNVLIGWINLEPSTSFNDTFDGFSKEQILAWLEKQGESYTKRDVDDAYLEGITVAKNEIEKQYEASYQIRKDIATFIFNYKGDIKDRAKWIDYLGIKASFVEKQDEQKETLCDKCKEEQPSHSCQDITALGRCALEALNEEKVDNADKVEPKFHEGEWVVNKLGDLWHIDSFDKKNYQVSDGKGNYNYFPISKQDEMRLYTIEDAKDGDLIYVSTEEKGIQAIFDTFDNGIIYFHCYLCRDFAQDGYMPMGDVELVYPLQKTHYKRFFEKMHEAGYEWDVEKKELKKIEQKPAWSKEDEVKMNRIVACLENLGVTDYDILLKDVDWLKSLRERCTWKPSDEQMEALESATENCAYSEYQDCLRELIFQLKKLREK